MRHWPERMSPANFSMSRNMGMQAAINTRRDIATQGPPPIAAPPVPDGPIHYSFNVPFASDLAGPNTEDILHATTDAVLRWTHPEEAPDDVPVHELPVHAMNLAQLRHDCMEITSNPLPIEAHVLSTTPKNVNGQVTTVCLSGAPDLVQQTRESLLNNTPLSLVGYSMCCRRASAPLLKQFSLKNSVARLSLRTGISSPISRRVFSRSR